MEMRLAREQILIFIASSSASLIRCLLVTLNYRINKLPHFVVIRGCGMPIIGQISVSRYTFRVPGVKEAT